MASTRSAVGGITGRPSVQPRSNISSASSAPAAPDTAATSSGSMAAFEEHPGLCNGSLAGGPARRVPRSAPAASTRAARAGWSHPVTRSAMRPSPSISTAVGTETSP